MTNLIALNIAERRAFAGGQMFGDTGAYERLTGRALFAVDPLAPAQADVVDLQFAPRDRDGMVHFAADFMILCPADPERGNKRVFYDYGNHGHKRALQFFNDARHSNDPATPAHAGNGFFMRRGYAVAWLAWEGDMLPGDNRCFDLRAQSCDGPIAPVGHRFLEQRGDHTQRYFALHRGRSRSNGCFQSHGAPACEIAPP